jgi:hypothetical protein
MWQRMACLVRWKWMCTLLSSRSMFWNNGEDKIDTTEKSRSIHVRWNSSTPIEPKMREVFGRMMIRGMHSVMNLNTMCGKQWAKQEVSKALTPKQDYRDGFLLRRHPTNVQIQVWNRIYDGRFCLSCKELVTRNVCHTSVEYAFYWEPFSTLPATVAEFMLCISCGLCSSSFCL